MLNIEELQQLISDLENDRVERTVSTREDKLGPAVCAFANDFPNHKEPGYILLGIKDDGTLAGMTWKDEDLQKTGNIKTNGNVLPTPSLVISPPFKFREGEVVVIEVKPCLYPPVRYDGRCWIRIGPRRSKATLEEERILIERRAANAKTFDLLPARGSSLKDMRIDYFLFYYIPKAYDAETIEQNGRTYEEQLASLRFYDPGEEYPTNAGILMFGIKPSFQIPGAYIQYVKFDGEDRIANVIHEKVFLQPYITGLELLENFISTLIIKKRPVREGDNWQERQIQNYPLWPLRELVMNAIVHRNYESNAPIYIYEYSNRIEIVNPGGLYGQATEKNFPYVSDYRNIVLAEAMRQMKFINKFNYGIPRAIEELKRSNNGEPDFDLSLVTAFKVTIYINREW